MDFTLILSENLFYHIRIVIIKFLIKFLLVLVGISHCAVKSAVGVVRVVSDCEIEPIGIACKVLEIFDFFFKLFFGACR